MESFSPSNHTSHRKNKPTGSLEVLGPGIWHALSMKPAYAELKPHQTLIPSNLVFDEIEFFLEVLQKRIDDDEIAAREARSELNGRDNYGPGILRPSDDHHLLYKRSKLRRKNIRNFT